MRIGDWSSDVCSSDLLVGLSRPRKSRLSVCTSASSVSRTATSTSGAASGRPAKGVSASDAATASPASASQSRLSGQGATCWVSTLSTDGAWRERGRKSARLYARNGGLGPDGGKTLSCRGFYRDAKWGDRRKRGGYRI